MSIILGIIVLLNFLIIITSMMSIKELKKARKLADKFQKNQTKINKAFNDVLVNIDKELNTTRVLTSSSMDSTNED